MSSTTSSSLIPSSTQSSPPGATRPSLETPEGILALVVLITSILYILSVLYCAYLRRRLAYNNAGIPLTTTPAQPHPSITYKVLACFRSDRLRKIWEKFRNRQTSKLEDV